MLLEVSPLICLLALVVGLCFGSFLNVLIYRIPVQLQSNWARDARDFLESEDQPEIEALKATPFNIAKPASHCPQCKAPLKPWHNIPLFSYLFLKGRCAHCHARISAQYPIVEFVAGLITLFIYLTYGISLESALALVFSLTLLVLTCIDFKTQLLPDILTLPLLWLGLLANTQHLFTDIDSAVIGAAAGYLSLWSIYWLFKLFTGKEGMGYGDFKLLAALGAWMGWQMLPLVILLSSFVGAVIGVAMIAMMGKDKQKPIAFGPYLAIAGWIAFFWGESIVSAYLGYLA
jgi:leader peptidase (prepilin peptidase) / N-methyltransferase